MIDQAEFARRAAKREANLEAALAAAETDPWREQLRADRARSTAAIVAAQSAARPTTTTVRIVQVHKPAANLPSYLIPIPEDEWLRLVEVAEAEGIPPVALVRRLIRDHTV